VALIPGMAAREVAVGALGTVYAIEAARKRPTPSARRWPSKWSLATALSFLAWFIFAPQCASTLAVIRRETGSTKWMVVTFGYMFALAYVASPPPRSAAPRRRRRVGQDVPFDARKMRDLAARGPVGCPAAARRPSFFA
jgi:hypothetical protein